MTTSSRARSVMSEVASSSALCRVRAIWLATILIVLPTSRKRSASTMLFAPENVHAK